MPLGEGKPTECDILTVKNHGLWEQNQVQTIVLPLTSCVSLAKLFNISDPQVSHYSHGDNDTMPDTMTKQIEGSRNTMCERKELTQVMTGRCVQLDSTVLGNKVIRVRSELEAGCTPQDGKFILMGLEVNVGS